MVMITRLRCWSRVDDFGTTNVSNSVILAKFTTLIIAKISSFTVTKQESWENCLESKNIDLSMNVFCRIATI